MPHPSNKISQLAFVTPRLKKTIMSCVDDKLVMLSGVAGLGKTRLMRAQFDAVKEKKGHHAIWISSARVSNDIFVSSESLQDILQSVVADVSADETWHVYIPDIDFLSPEDFAFLESFALVTDENVHIVASAREGLYSYFKRMQLDVRVTEISRGDLTLTEDEVRGIAMSHNQSLNPDYMTRLFEITLGWPALVEASLAKASTTQELNELCNTSDYMKDRIVSGLFERLDSEEIEFLVSVCWLDEFDASLAKCIQKTPLPGRIIARLQAQNVLVECGSTRNTSQGGGCLRCHPFFTQSIRSYALANTSGKVLEQKMNEIIDCYEDNDEPLKAFQIALASNMPDRAFCLLADNTFAILPHVDAETLHRLTDSVNREAVADEYLYLLVTSWVAFMSGKHRRARFLLGKAERCKGDAMGQPRIRGVLMLAETIRVGCSVFQGEYEKAISLGQELIEHMGGPQLFLRCTIMHNMAEAYLRLGKYGEAKDALLRASADAHVSGRHVVELLCEADIAWLKFMKGDLDASSNVTLRALARAEEGKYRRDWSVGVLYVSLARVYLQWCEIEKACIYLDLASELLSPDNNRDAFLELKVTLVRLLELTGKHEESYEEIVMAHEMTLWDDVPRGVDLLVTITFAEVLVARNRHDEALALVDGLLLNASQNDDFYRIHADLIRARALVVGHAAVEEAASILENALKRANETGQLLLATDCKIRLACVYRIEGRVQDGVSLMAQALEECSKEGRVYPFRGPLPFQNALVYEVAFPTSSNLVVDSSRKDACDYARRIIGYLKEQGSSEYAAENGEGIDEDRYAELTPRERDVCELLRQGKTRQEIADELGLKLNTVRTHIRNAYRRLDIHERSML